MKILVLAPYYFKLLKAIEAISKLNICEFYLLGDKKQILETCYRYKIEYQNFEIKDCKNDVEIVLEAKERLLNFTSLVLIGNLSYYYQRKIFNFKDNEDFSYINIIDFPPIKHFIFISNYSLKNHVDLEDKKKAIIQTSTLMNSLGIKKTNVALITTQTTRAETLEANIVKMILKDSNLSHINYFDSFKLYDLFSTTSEINIYKNNINLLVLRNYEASKIFIDTLNIFGNCKIGQIMIYNDTYAIDTNSMKDEQDIVFSTIILSKIYNIKTKKDVKKVNIM